MKKRTKVLGFVTAAATAAVGITAVVKKYHNKKECALVLDNTKQKEDSEITPPYHTHIQASDTGQINQLQ